MKIIIYGMGFYLFLYSVLILSIWVLSGCAKSIPPTSSFNRTGEVAEAEISREPEVQYHLEIDEAAPVFDNILFDFDSYAVKDEITSGFLLEYMTVKKNREVVLRGHTCKLGTEEYNISLGEHRAAAVRDYLVAGGVSPKRIQVVSMGEEIPVSENLNLNRRVEIEIH